jgi:hypothetical protein
MAFTALKKLAQLGRRALERLGMSARIDNPKTLEFANQCRRVAQGCDDLARALPASDPQKAALRERYGKLMQAANDLDALDAIDKLSDAGDIKTLQDLTKTMNDQAAKIAKQQAHVSAIVDIADNILNAVVNFKSGNIFSAVSYAGNAYDELKKL